MLAESRVDPRRSPAPGTRQLTVLIKLVHMSAAIAAVAAGCGGGQSVEEGFADDVCSTTLLRANELLETLHETTRTHATAGRDGRITLLTLAGRGTETMRRFHDDLRGIDVPATKNGAEAATYLQQLSGTPLATLVEAERSIRALPQDINLNTSKRALQDLERALSQAFSEMTAAQFVIMENLPSLRDAFEDVDSCKELVDLQTD